MVVSLYTAPLLGLQGLSWACTFIGLAIPCYKYFSKEAESVNYFACFWIGITISVLIAQIWHAFLPIDWKFSLLLSLAGWGFLGKYIILSNPHFQLSLSQIFFLIVFAVIVFSLASLPPSHFDSGLYHFASVKWLNEWAIVPGLGNLHGRLAFNQSYFFLPAIFNVQPFLMQGHHIVNALLLFIFLAELSTTLLDKSKASTKKPFPHKACLFLAFLPVMALLAKQGYFNSNISSPTPDLSIFIISVILSGKILDIIESNSIRPTDVLFILATASLGITLKLSFAIFALGMFIVVTYFLYKNRVTYFNAISSKQLLFLLFVLALLGGTWIVRGFITSGYPLYPATFAKFDVDWAIPESTPQDDITWKILSARAEKKWITSWGRADGKHYTEVLGKYEWVRPWLHSTFTNPIHALPLAILIVSVFLLLLKMKQWFVPYKSITILILPITASIGFWFYSSPNPRFLGSWLWLMSILFALPILKQLFSIGWLRSKTQWATYICLLGVCIGFGFQVLNTHKELMQPSSIPQSSIKTYITESGLVLNAPENTTQSWDAALPTTPYPKSNLELRGDTLQDGFRVTN